MTEASTTGWLESRACFAVCGMTMFVNGIMYAFPMLTPKLLAEGVSSSQIVLAGVMIQLGYNSVCYPFGLIYPSNLCNLSPLGMDRACNAFALSLVIISTLLMVGLAHEAEVHNTDINGKVLCFAFLLWGSGLGLSSFHSLSLINFIFAADKRQRRMGVASMTFSLGIGAVVYTLMYHYVFSLTTLTYNFVILLGLYAILGGFRFKYMARGRFESVPVLELPVELPELSSVIPTSGSGAVVLPNDVSTTPQQQRQEQEQRLTQNEGGITSIELAERRSSSIMDVAMPVTTTAMQTPVQPLPTTPPPNANISSTPPKFKDYVTSPIVWYTVVSTFFGFGVGSTYLSSLGNLAATLVSTDEAADTVTYNLTLCFLCFVILARLITTIIYAHMNWPYVMALWNLLVFVGVLVYMTTPNLLGAYFSAAVVGFGFGGVSSVPAVIATTNFPGSIAYYGLNLSVAASVMAIGPFLIGYMETIIHEKSSLAGFRDRDFDYMSSFVYFLCGSFVSTACSVLLGYEIHKDYKLEMSTMRAAEMQTQATLHQEVILPDETSIMLDGHGAPNSADNGASSDNKTDRDAPLTATPDHPPSVTHAHSLELQIR
mmetsp:Transcript_22785/g.44773  ORF Transcript_22785/g.44773 Transcript_22785/m.44773 type:complete len:600 (+) Transcript_22785:213-2012(+)|eukprot:CAMPEP_0171514484 /NCGR_PEP_ID=MMETSP0959-20130129/2872_1 /TAXON_ID=87120 /ORGANISM="Aurantiochytrium limacinum, Strain ATCCMYA-1381" /LENGTH=599 /DNA_ID=CAMNT_0012052819 /DNA_START=178 /DNA_END=1977 /DNA_ORIENTATION=+